jgi:hypothetical protein
VVIQTKCSSTVASSRTRRGHQPAATPSGDSLPAASGSQTAGPRRRRRLAQIRRICRHSRQPCCLPPVVHIAGYSRGWDPLAAQSVTGACVWPLTCRIGTAWHPDRGTGVIQPTWCGQSRWPASGGGKALPASRPARRRGRDKGRGLSGARPGSGAIVLLWCGAGSTARPWRWRTAFSPLMSQPETCAPPTVGADNLIHVVRRGDIRESCR